VKPSKKNRCAKVARLSINARERRRMHDLVSLKKVFSESVKEEKEVFDIFCYHCLRRMML